jgi:hypothetical protein
MRAFGSFMTWLAMRAGPAEAACAIRADLLLWCGVCEALAETMRRLEPGLPAPVVEYFALFSTPPERFIAGAREVAAYGLARGEEPAVIGHAVAQVEPVLAGFWAASLKPAAPAAR